MTNEEFNEVVEYRIGRIREVLQKKAKEYATDDRLHNFKIAARILNTTPEKALLGMAMKHAVSVLDLIEGRNLEQHIIDEKCGDLINYVILLEAMLLKKCEGYNGVLYRD